jgi:hypothetical protein
VLEDPNNFLISKTVASPYFDYFFDILATKMALALSSINLEGTEEAYL